jgi:hypothetical protein
MSENKQVKQPQDTAARDFAFVINNPKISEQELYNHLENRVNVRYFVFVREKGDNGTEHYQGYIEFSKPKKFSLVKKYFSEEQIGTNAHISERIYARLTCVKYVKKEDKFADKAHTRIGKIYEYGDFAKSGQRNDLIDMVEMKRQGATDLEIFETYPYQAARYGKFVTSKAMEHKEKDFKAQYRENLEVYYIHGATRTGKTRFVFDKHGYENVYQNEGYEYGKWFDGYEGQDILLLDEYRTSLGFGFLLKLLDGHPLKIQCRYQNKWACFTKIYITSNLPLEAQHQDTQYGDPESWKAFLARITAVYNFDEKNKGAT